jgi:hypothetical protein
MNTRPVIGSSSNHAARSTVVTGSTIVEIAVRDEPILLTAAYKPANASAVTNPSPSPCGTLALGSAPPNASHTTDSVSAAPAAVQADETPGSMPLVKD